MKKKSLVLALPLLAGVLTAAVDGRKRPECEIAAEWVAANVERLPKTLAGISEYNAEHRKAIFRALPRDVQLRLWHEQLAYYSASSELTETQRAFVKELDGVLDQYFGKENSAKFDSVYKARKLEILGPQLSGRILGNLGINTPELTAQAQETALVDCECNITESYCSAGMRCSGATGCTVTTPIIGCGDFWCEDCNGMCRIT
jgi:hypothetical protein